jgi:hypothetical protein
VLLRKLGTYNHCSLLYRAFREIGRVERTLFLLRFIADTEIHRTVRAETTKIEAFNDFLDWVSFGRPVIRSGDPIEQEKQLKCASLVANAVMLSNVADLTATLVVMDHDGRAVTPALVGCLSPTTREHIRRFGQYVLDMGASSTRATGLRRSIRNHCRLRWSREDFDTYPQPTPTCCVTNNQEIDYVPTLRPIAPSLPVAAGAARWRPRRICSRTQRRGRAGRHARGHAG